MSTHRTIQRAMKRTDKLRERSRGHSDPVCERLGLRHTSFLNMSPEDVRAARLERSDLNGRGHLLRLETKAL